MGDQKKIVGGKKALIESTAIIDPENNKLVVSKQQIKTVTLKYCHNTLSNNVPGKEYEELIKLKKTRSRKKVVRI